MTTTESIKNKLKNPNTLTSLKFRSFESESNGILSVTYYGHEVGGSYVHDWQVAPKYVEDLQYSCNRRVVWLRSTSGGIGHDIYWFDVYLDTKVESNPYEPIGKILRVSNSYIAFDYDCGHSWAMLYILYKSLLNNEIPKNVGIELKKNRKGKDVIYFDKKQVAVVVEYEKEEWKHFKGHKTDYNRKRTHCIFDLLIPEMKFQELYLEKYKNIVNSYFLNVDLKCSNVRVLCDFEYGNKIELRFDNGLIEKIGPDWYIFGEKQSEYILKRKDKIFITIRLITRYYQYKEKTRNLEFHEPPNLKNIVTEFFPKYQDIIVNGEKVTDFDRILKSKDVVEAVIFY